MLAERLSNILPPMTDEQAMETATIASISDHGFLSMNWKRRPIRTNHYTASGVALSGVGSNLRSGEISLAHTWCFVS